MSLLFCAFRQLSCVCTEHFEVSKPRNEDLACFSKNGKPPKNESS